MSTSPELNGSTADGAGQRTALRSPQTNGARWVSVVSLTWMVTVVGFSVAMVVERAAAGSRLDEWGDPVDAMLGGLGILSFLYLYLLPIACLMVVVANVVDLARNLAMGPVAQVVRMLTILAAAAAPIVTFQMLRS